MQGLITDIAHRATAAICLLNIPPSTYRLTSSPTTLSLTHMTQSAPVHMLPITLWTLFRKHMQPANGPDSSRRQTRRVDSTISSKRCGQVKQPGCLHADLGRPKACTSTGVPCHPFSSRNSFPSLTDFSSALARISPKPLLTAAATWGILTVRPAVELLSSHQNRNPMTTYEISAPLPGPVICRDASSL